MAILKFKDPITGLWNAVKIYARSLGFSVDGVGADSEGNVPLGALRLTGGNMTDAMLATALSLGRITQEEYDILIAIPLGG